MGLNFPVRNGEGWIPHAMAALFLCLLRLGEGFASLLVITLLRYTVIPNVFNKSLFDFAAPQALCLRVTLEASPVLIFVARVVDFFLCLPCLCAWLRRQPVLEVAFPESFRAISCARLCHC